MTRFDAPCEQVAATLDVDDVIMDGEVIAADETGRPQFYDLLRCARKPAYVAFDLLWPDGVDLRSLPSERASGGACKESFPRIHRPLPKSSLFGAGDGSSSSSCTPTTSRGSSQSG